ncbi:MAG: HmuY family protein [Bacteroidales bacterium]
MNKLQSTIFFVISILLFSSCFKEDDKVEPYDRGDVIVKTVEMTQYYTYQTYFDLEEGKEVAVNNKNEWDLGFECSEEGSHILLNTSAFMVAANTGLKDFEIVPDTSGLKWRFDQSDGNLDSTAIGNWFSIDMNDTIYTHDVYLIDRGYTDLGVLRGIKKVQFENLSNGNYTFRYANPDGTDEHSFVIEKDPSSSFTNFSFSDGGKQLSLEPPFDTWDIVFTQYTTLLYTDEGDPYPYLVTGVLSNRVDVEVARDTVTPFSDMALDIVNDLEFSPILDQVGYDWKVLEGDVNSGNVSYNIVPGLSYIVKNRNGFYFKLRFTGFYNTEGQKGYPTIEFKLL